MVIQFFTLKFKFFSIYIKSSTKSFSWNRQKMALPTNIKITFIDLKLIFNHIILMELNIVNAKFIFILLIKKRPFNSKFLYSSSTWSTNFQSSFGSLVIVIIFLGYQLPFNLLHHHHAKNLGTFLNFVCFYQIYNTHLL